MADYIEIALRTFGAFLLFLIIARMLGKQAIAQMTLHDFIAAITLGGIIGNLTFNLKVDFKHITTALLLFGGIAIASSIISIKSRKGRKLLSGNPTVLIQDGKILEHNMGKIKYTLDYLNQALREKDIFDINEVEYAVLEIDGHISVLKKPPFRNVTRKDLGIITPDHSDFPIELIMDGKIIEKNLKENNLTKEWLLREIEKNELSLEDICYAVRGTNKQIYFDLYSDKIMKPIDRE